MNKIKTIYSLKELHDLIEKHEDKKRLMIFFDLDLTIIKGSDDDQEIDILIEPRVTKELFSYIKDNQIYFSFVTARFHDTVCNKKKRNLKEIEENLYATIFPVLEELGLDLNYYKRKELGEKFHIVKNDKGRTVGILYRGIFYGGRKGEIIKHYRKEFGLDKSHPHTIFIDDHETYLKSVGKHVPDCIILRREIKET